MSCLSLMLCEIEGKWPYSQSSHLGFSLRALLKSMQGNHTIVPTWLQLGRIPILFSQRVNFHIVNKLSIAVHAFLMHILTSLSVDEILLPSYAKWSTDFQGLLFNVMAPSSLKHTKSVLFEFTWRPTPLAACSRLCNRHSTWATVFVRSAKQTA